MSKDKEGEEKPSMGSLIKRKESKEAGEKPGRKKTPKVARKVKGFLIGLEYIRAFEVLKAETGIPGPELAEEALRLLLDKYGKSLKL